jgi:hypothetical protein
MLRPRPDLDAIDRELEQLGAPREDVADLVAKYAAQGGSIPPLDSMRVARSGADPAAPAASSSEIQPSDDDDLDHDDFELLVDDADMDRVEEDDELESVA